MSTRRLLFTLAWLVTFATAIPGDELPGDAAKRINEFETEVEAIHKKSDAEIKVRRGKLIKDLEALQVAYTKAGKLDEAKAIRDRREQLKTDVAEDYALEIRRLEGHTDEVYIAAFSSDGQTLASAGRDGTIRLWNWKTGKLLATLTGHTTEEVYDADYAPDGKTLVTASHDKTVVLWDPLKKEKRATLDDHGGWVRAARFSPDGKTLATASEDTLVFVREPTGKLLHRFEGHKQAMIALAYSPDGKTLVSAGGNWGDTKKGGEVWAWDLESGKKRWVAAGEFAGIWGVAFAPDGKSVAGASIDGTVRIWEAEERQVLKGHTDRVLWVAYTRSGKTLVSVGIDGTIRLWDSSTGKEKAVLKGHTAWVGRLAFSPDGRVMATTSGDRTIRIWQLGRLDQRTGLFTR
jgi:WD40 repeat protein